MTEQSGGGRGWLGRQQGWDPMGELQSLRAELRRLVGGRPGGQDVELTEVSDGWEVIVRLPGVAPEEVAVELDDRELCVRARSEAEVNADHGIPGGFETRGFEYRVDLPSRVDPDRIDAVMDHGLLRVRLPRAARPSPRTITVGRTGPRATGIPGGTASSADPAADRELHHPDTTVDEIDRP
jgi:HSP20 family protein